MTVKIAAGI